MAKGKFAKQSKRPPFWYFALLVLFTGILGYCLWYLGDYFIGSQQQAESYEDLAALVEAARSTAPTRPREEKLPTDAQGDPIPTDGDFEMMKPAKIEDIHDENGILLEYAPLYEKNPDLAGWLRIEGTRIDYPVMHTPGRADYYLRRDFEGKYSSWGCLYAREECDFLEPSDNITIYGHNMKDGSMFAGLNNYRQKSYWEDHRYLTFDTVREHHTYTIFAVFTTTATEGQGFDYHNFINAVDEQAFDTFIAKCLSNSLYGTDIVPEYGDKIICLSTCEYSQTNGRLVVAAVRID